MNRSAGQREYLAKRYCLRMLKTEHLTRRFSDDYTVKSVMQKVIAESNSLDGGALGGWGKKGSLCRNPYL